MLADGKIVEREKLVLRRLAQMLGLSQLVQDLMMRPMTENDAYINFTFNRIVLDHEARDLGIRPSSKEVVAFVKTLLPFQGTNGTGRELASTNP